LGNLGIVRNDDGVEERNPDDPADVRHFESAEKDDTDRKDGRADHPDSVKNVIRYFGKPEGLFPEDIGNAAEECVEDSPKHILGAENRKDAMRFGRKARTGAKRM
jgi:hypothetical protein